MTDLHAPRVRRTLVFVAVLFAPLTSSCTPEAAEPFDVVEATIPAMQAAMEEGRITSRELVEAHLIRIALYEEKVNAAIAINPNALSDADRLDRERADGRVRGPLHGIPVALKDNVHTMDMPTTGGALAFEGFIPPYDLAHERAGSNKYDQANLDRSDEVDLEEARPTYEADRARDLYLNGEHGIDEVMTDLELDALLFPSSSGAGISAKPGYPTVIVPFAFLDSEPSPPLPEGFAAKPRPFGASFAGMACSEPKLIEMAFSFEQATKRRVAPPGMP